MILPLLLHPLQVWHAHMMVSSSYHKICKKNESPYQHDDSFNDRTPG
jgi:hypothetical protein